jgi:hypothetical protein
MVTSIGPRLGLVDATRARLDRMKRGAEVASLGQETARLRANGGGGD